MMDLFFPIDQLFDYLDVLSPSLRERMREYLEHAEEYEAQPEQVEAEKESGETEDVFDDFLFAVIDQRHLLDRPKRKWYTTNTQLGDRTGGSRLTLKRGVCFHHTAVYHGAGARKAVRAKYDKLVAGAVHMLDREMILSAAWGGDAKWLQLNQDLTPDQWARAMAVAGRMRGEGPNDAANNGFPYQVIRCSNSVLVLNLPFEMVTWASNGANTDFAAFGWDAHSTKEGIEDADDLCADVEFTVKTMRDEGHPCTEFTAHCAYTNKPTDPGAEFISKIMEPVAKETGCTIDYHFKVRGARSIGEVLEAV
jgi:hypothetical protein